MFYEIGGLRVIRIGKLCRVGLGWKTFPRDFGADVSKVREQGIASARQNDQA